MFLVSYDELLLIIPKKKISYQWIQKKPDNDSKESLVI